MMCFNRSNWHFSAVFGGFLLFYLAFFASVLLGGRLLAYGDGIGYFLPAYYASKGLWTDLIFGGYPIAADPQNMTWYPPAMLLSWIPGSWNGFVLLAYVLAASFMYYYVYALTASRLASVGAGLVYSMSGFMMGHLTMIGLVHAAAWIPLCLLALEQLRQRVARRWLVIGVVALVCCLLGGHPQSSLAGLGLSGLYALVRGWQAPIGRWKYYRYGLAVFAIGIGIAAIQLLPSVELSRLSLRSDLTQAAFLAGSLWPKQALQYLFPFLFGSEMALPPYTLAYWGKDGNPADIATYMGILPLILTAIAIVTHHRQGVVRLWCGVGLVAFFLIFGKYQTLATLAYYVPFYNAFRIPARHSLELALAVSVLTGFGLAAVQQQAISRRWVRRILGVSLAVMGLAIGLLGRWTPAFQTVARSAKIAAITFWPWENPAVAVPLVIFSASCLVLAFWSRDPRSRGRVGLLLIVLVLDLVSFSFWFHNWPVLMPPTAKLIPGPIVSQYRQALAQTHQRLLIDHGTWSQATPDVNQPIFPNLTRLWQLPSVGGYSPLMLTRVSQMTATGNDGMLLYPPQSVLDRDRGLDLMSVRYRLQAQLAPDLLKPAADVMPAEIVWSDRDLGLGLGAVGNASLPQSVLIHVPDRLAPTTEIAVVTALGNSVGIPQQAAVMQVQVIDRSGQVVESHDLRAGRDTAEAVYDCPDVQPQMQHQRATIHQTLAIVRPGVGACAAYQYRSRIKLDQPRSIQQLRLQWQYASGTIAVAKITLIDTRPQTFLPLESTAAIAKWRAVERFSGGVMYENQQVLPRAWLVSRTVLLPPEQILAAIRTSQLPDGQVYRPEQMALVEVPQAQFAAAPAPGQVEIQDLQPTRVRLRTQTATPQFLVLSDVFYPGWQATIDGHSTPIFQTNYVQRGVLVPAGEHVVEYRFMPISFKLGVGIAMASCGVGIYGLWRRPR
jgi:Bacterial membrane protein YfhO